MFEERDRRKRGVSKRERKSPNNNGQLMSFRRQSICNIEIMAKRGNGLGQRRVKCNLLKSIIGTTAKEEQVHVVVSILHLY